MLTVAKSGNDDFTSIQDAVDHAFPGETIYIKPGIYNERVTINKDNLILIGSNTLFREHLGALGISEDKNKGAYSVDKEKFSIAAYLHNEDIQECISPNAYIESDKTIITYGLYGKMPAEDIGKLGTFRTYTMFIDAKNVRLENLTIENSAGAGNDIGQAIALYAEGEGIQCRNIRLLGWQDTLFTGPLPPKEIEKNGFIGPKQYSPRINGRQYYENCYIEGDIDFIFGSATAYFDSCVIFQKDREKLLQYKNNKISEHDGNIPDAKVALDDAKDIKSYATAPSTPDGQDYGYVFDNCSFLSDCPDDSCYLGRPWRNYAAVLVKNSYLGPQISSEGFHNWNKKDAESTVRFYEYQNFGEGVSTHRASFARELSDSDISYFNKKQVLPFLD